MDSFQIELQLILTSGAFGSLGHVDFIGWLTALNVPGFAQGHMFSLYRTGQENELRTHEAEISVSEIAPIVDLLEKVGFPGSTPRIDAVADTSDSWEQVNFHVTLNNRADTLRLRLSSSSFSGEDTATFQQLFSILFEIGKLNPRLYGNLTGR